MPQQPKPYKPTKTEQLKASAISTDQLWDAYFRCPPGERAIQILAEITRTGPSVSNDVGEED